MPLDAHDLDSFLLIGSAVIVAAIMAVRVSSRLGFPSLLLYLLIGVGLGEGGLGIVFDDAAAAHALGFGALVIILAEGGLTTRWKEIRGSMRLGVALATFGMGISVAVVAVGAHYLLQMSWQTAVLLGAITSATDAAAVFSVLRSVPLPRRVVGVLESESGLNDAPTVVLVTLVASGAALDDGPLVMLGVIGFELAVGVLVGLLVGVLGAWLLRSVALPSSGLYPLAAVALTVLAYGSGAALHASGFASVYVAALLLGNADLPHRMATRSFVEGLAWLAQIGLFVMLGLLLSPSTLDLNTLLTALLGGLILTLVARPLSVALSAVVQRMSIRELAFISWAGLRGAVPIVFATIPLAAGVPDAERLFNVVFVMVVVYTLITGPTLPTAARVLGVASRAEPRDLQVEAAPLDRVAADLLQVTITEHSQMHGVEVGELRLPAGVSISLIIRGETTLVPAWRTVLRRGDELLVVTPRPQREATVKRLREVSIGGRLAHWLGRAELPE